MECEEIRAALSARLDGEQASIADEVIDAHLGACEECRAWYERAVRLNRALTVGPGLYSLRRSVSGRSDLKQKPGLKQ